MVGRLVRWWRRAAARVRFAALLLAGVAVGWPLSAVTFARSEPPVVLGLSWLAIGLTAVDILFTSQVHEQTGDGTKGDR